VQLIKDKGSFPQPPLGAFPLSFHPLSLAPYCKFGATGEALGSSSSEKEFTQEPLKDEYS